MDQEKLKYTHVIWDWNGTLLDDVGAALKSVNAMLERRGKQPINLAQYHDYLDIPIKKFYENIFDLEKDDYSEILKEYNDGYESQMYEISLAHGERETLNRIREAGVRQLIVSSCEQNQLNYYLKHFDLEHYFDAVLGSEDFFAGSKVQRAKNYLKSENIDPAMVLVVGDLVHDYEMARNIGADCVLVSIGHHSEKRLRESGAKVADSISQILKDDFV